MFFEAFHKRAEANSVIGSLPGLIPGLRESATGKLPGAKPGVSIAPKSDMPPLPTAMRHDASQNLDPVLPPPKLFKPKKMPK